MADYQKMYSTLFNTISEVIDILQKVQQTTEELYISDEAPIVTLLSNSNIGEEDENRF